MRLVDLPTAKEHLKVDDDAADVNIAKKIDQASAIVVDYLKLADPDQWDIDSTESEAVPPVVEAAILLVLEALFDGGEPLSQTVRDLLHRYRDPAFV